MTIKNKVQKFIGLLTLIIICTFSFGCGLFEEMFSVKLVDNDGVIKLDIEEEYKKYFPYLR